MTTTLILGAGASYGYPSGDQLVEQIKNKLRGERDQTAREIFARLESHNPDSIDEYVRDFTAEGTFLKSVIAEVLFEHEDPTLLIPRNEDLYRHLILSIPKEKYSDFRIITFNYDRSMEYVFRRHLGTYHRDFRAISDALEPLKILHVHGRLPALPGEEEYKLATEREQFDYGFGREGYGIRNFPDRAMTSDDDYSPFDEDTMANRGRQHVQMISAVTDTKRRSINQHGRSNFKFVHEGQTQEKAKAILEESSRIIFLGFGYHPLNMSYLGLNFSEEIPGKRVFGTSYRIPPTRIKELKHLYPAIRFKDCKAMDMFANHCHLTNPQFDDED